MTQPTQQPHASTHTDPLPQQIRRSPRWVIPFMVVLPALAALCLVCGQAFTLLEGRIALVPSDGIRQMIIAKLETSPGVRLTTAIVSGGVALSVIAGHDERPQ